MVVISTIILLTGCFGPVAEVPPAHVGKLSTESGLQKGIIPPSKFRLEGWCINCDNLILAETSDYPVSEAMRIYMPADQLNIEVDIRGIFTVDPSDKANVENIFARITANPLRISADRIDERIRIISIRKVYDTYAQPVVREVVRSVITKFTIAQIMENRDAVSQQLAQAVRKKLKATPINTIQFGLADVQPPEVIVKAREAAKEREIAIQRAEADKQVSLKQAEAALEVAVKQQQVDLKEAETQVLVNKKLAEGVNEAFVTQRWLKIMEHYSKNPEAKVFLMPFEAINNPALLMGTYNRALAQNQ